MALFFSLSGVIVVVGALLWWRINQVAEQIRQSDERARIQVDSYGATVGELIDYAENKLKEEK